MSSTEVQKQNARNYYVNKKIRKPGYYKELARDQHKKREARPASFMLYRAKRSAKIRNLEFTLELKDIPKIPEFCPVFSWIRLKYKVGRGRSDSSPSLDRIDNGKGYVPGNIRIISDRANKLKSDATDQELVALAEDTKKSIFDRLNFEPNDEILYEFAFGCVDLILRKLLYPISRIEIVEPVNSFNDQAESVGLKPLKFKAFKKKQQRPISNIRTDIKLIWDKENQRWLEQAA